MTTDATRNPRKKKGARDPATLTPEYIAEQRKLRELKKQQRRDELAAQGIDPDAKAVPANLQFIRREQLKLPGQEESDQGFQVSIMSYNILAQALIRRKLFPTSGHALKWSNRSLVLLSEFKHYNADIVCLQEVDFIQFNSHWKKEFHKLGYGTQYYRSGMKNHGVAVIYKQDKFQFQNSMYIDYDKVSTGNCAPKSVTQNVGLMVYLKFTEEVLKSHPNLSKEGIIIGTTHLFWHPFGTYDRTRQTYIVLQQMKEFTRNMNLLYGTDKKFYRFFAGDFNSQPYDTPYLSMTAKPVLYSDRAKNVIGRSLAHDWNQRSASEEAGFEEEQDEEDESNEQTEDKKKDEKIETLDDNPVPETFNFSPAILAEIEKIEKLHNDFDLRSISLYSVGYHSVHPENAGRDNKRNEPMFSNWAHTWRGLLDYIFVIADWDKSQNHSDKVDTTDLLEDEQEVKLLSLLRLPTPEEMGEEPSGQPRAGQYPSDHLCIMARVELC